MRFSIGFCDLCAGFGELRAIFAPAYDDELIKRIQALLDGDEGTYLQLKAKQYANFCRNYRNQENFTINWGDSLKAIKVRSIEQRVKITAFLNRRHKQSARISQGDFKSTSFTACMPVPPTMIMKGGLYHTAEAEV